MPFTEFEGIGTAYAPKPYPPEESMRMLGAVLLEKATTEPKPGMRDEFALLSEAFPTPEMQGPLYVMCERRPNMNPGYRAQLLVRVKRYIEQRWDTPAPNPKSLRQLIQDYQAAFVRNLITRDITSTKAHRIKVTAVAEKAYGAEESTLVDFGAGQNHNLHLLAMTPGEGFRYTPTVLGQLAISGRVRNTRNQPPLFLPNETQSQAFNKVLEEPFGLAYGLGIDINDPYGEDNMIWSRICSVNADEMSPDAIEEFERLSAVRPDNVGVMPYVNFAERFEDEIKDGKLLLGQEFRHRKQKILPQSPDLYDAALFSFSTYQLKDQKQLETAIQNAQNITTDDGRIYILDAMKINRNKKIQYYDNREPYAIALYAYDKTNPEAGFRKLFTIGDGRVSHVVIEKAFGELPLAREMGLAPLAPPAKNWFAIKQSPHRPDAANPAGHS